MQSLHNIKAEGDDLISAQVFVTSVKVEMDILSSVDRFDPARARQAVISVRDGAQKVFAKAIIRVCDHALDLIDQKSAQPKIDSLFMTLQKLISQYAYGLDEVLSTSHEVRGQTKILQKTEDVIYLQPGEVTQNSQDTLPDIVQDTSTLPANDLPIQSELETEILPQMSPPLTQDDMDTLSAAHKKARHVLVPLLHLAKDLKNKAALERLALRFEHMAVDPHDINVVPFENIMPSVINSILTDARQLGKNASVSYLDNETQIPDSHAETIKTSLKELGRYLVRESLETPKARTLRGQSSIGQISITATSDAKGIGMTLTCEGAQISDVSSSKIKSIPEGYKVSLKPSEKDNETIIALSISHLNLNRQTSPSSNRGAVLPRFPLSRDAYIMNEGGL